MENINQTMETMLDTEAQKHLPVQQPAPIQQPEENMQLKLRAQELITQARTIWAVTQTDVMAAWKMLQVLIAEALANGQRVELGELGILSLDVRTKELKEPGTRLRPADIEVGSVSFKPGALLLKQLQRVTF